MIGLWLRKTTVVLILYTVISLKPLILFLVINFFTVSGVMVLADSYYYRMVGVMIDCTRVDSAESEMLPLISSIIDPLLFATYINELAEILRESDVVVRLFTDDLKMYARVNVTVLRNALSRLVEWADLWRSHAHTIV